MITAQAHVRCDRTSAARFSAWVSSHGEVPHVCIDVVAVITFGVASSALSAHRAYEVEFASYKAEESYKSSYKAHIVHGFTFSDERNVAPAAKSVNHAQIPQLSEAS